MIRKRYTYLVEERKGPFPRWALLLYDVKREEVTRELGLFLTEGEANREALKLTEDER